MESFEAHHFKKAFGAVIALREANFSFEGPKVVAWSEQTVPGKRRLPAFAPAWSKDAGEFVIDGQMATINSPGDARSYGIVLAHQNLSLIPDLTVWENISLQ